MGMLTARLSGAWRCTKIACAIVAKSASPSRYQSRFSTILVMGFSLPIVFSFLFFPRGFSGPYPPRCARLP